VVATWRDGVAEEGNCCVDLIHHARKGKPGGNMEYGVDDGRGAGALKDAARDVRIYNLMTADEADEYRVPKSERWRHIRVESGKPNMAARNMLTRWRQIVSVDLGNARDARPGELRGRAADSVGVVALWEPPVKDALADGIKQEAILRAARDLYNEGVRITFDRGQNKIASMVDRFKERTGMPVSRSDIAAAFNAACNSRPPTWKYQNADSGARIKAGYEPLDAAPADTTPARDEAEPD
jgi:hypothetical protein